MLERQASRHLVGNPMPFGDACLALDATMARLTAVHLERRCSPIPSGRFAGAVEIRRDPWPEEGSGIIGNVQVWAML